MNKKDIIQVLESCLLSIDGMNEHEIIKLNSDFDSKLINVGIKLKDYLVSLDK